MYGNGQNHIDGQYRTHSWFTLRCSQFEFLEKIPAPFLGGFQRYSLSVYDFYQIKFEQLSDKEQSIMKNIEAKLHTLIKHSRRQYYYDFNDDALY